MTRRFHNQVGVVGTDAISDELQLDKVSTSEHYKKSKRVRKLRRKKDRNNRSIQVENEADNESLNSEVISPPKLLSMLKLRTRIAAEDQLLAPRLSDNYAKTLIAPYQPEDIADNENPEVISSCNSASNTLPCCASSTQDILTASKSTHSLIATNVNETVSRLKNCTPDTDLSLADSPSNSSINAVGGDKVLQNLSSFKPEQNFATKQHDVNTPTRAQRTTSHAVCIQMHYRRYLARKKYHIMPSSKAKYSAEHCAAIQVQRYVRGFIVRQMWQWEAKRFIDENGNPVATQDALKLRRIVRRRQAWPDVLNLEKFETTWNELNDTIVGPNGDLEIVTKEIFLRQGKIRVFCGSWNLHAQIPSDDAMKHWIPLNRYHIIALGTQECVNSIAKSIVYTSKKVWEVLIQRILGPNYIMISSHALTAIHNAVFVHISILPFIHNIQSDAVATGIANRLGNKGGVGIAFSIGKTSFVFIGSHFDAHQHQTCKRNQNFARINSLLRLSPTRTTINKHSSLNNLREPKNDLEHHNVVKSSNLKRQRSLRAMVQRLRRGSVSNVIPCDSLQNTLDTNCKPSQDPPEKESNSLDYKTSILISNKFDRIFWYGDLNYRINGTRKMVNTCLRDGHHEILLQNDQLQREKSLGNVFQGFHEGPLYFKPTYKFDHYTDRYDTSVKQRIPSWTDRVLYKSNNTSTDVPIELLSYRNVEDACCWKVSDHRPVAATFNVRITLENISDIESDNSHAYFLPIVNQRKSEVCTIQ